MRNLAENQTRSVVDEELEAEPRLFRAQFEQDVPSLGESRQHLAGVASGELHSAARRSINILTFDIEDWFHLLDNDSTRTVSQWTSFAPRIEANTDRILDLLAAKCQKATFFCLGWIADRHPDVIRRIDAMGHEIGSHTYSHQLVYQQTPLEFKQDLAKSVAVLEDLTGKKVRSFRAPGFSATEDCTSLFDALAELEIEIDCSVFPANRAHGGFRSFAAIEPVTIEYRGARIKEFPLNVYQFMGRRIVFSGGGYFRLLPYWAIRSMMQRSNYVMTYFHPRDFDPYQPVIKDLSWGRRFKSYVGLSSAFDKLKKLISDFQFVDLRTAEQYIDWNRTINL
jgi:polysaccharide deacetylase family protein (PEP-CTERM system associated)